MKLSVRHVDDDTLYRATEARLGHRTVKTPLKALDRTRLPPAHPLPTEAAGINEIWRQVDPAQLTAAMTDKEAEQAFTRGIRSSLRQAAVNDEVSVTFTQVPDPRLPTKELRFLADLVYTHTDFVAVPLVKDIHRAVKGANDPFFKAYLKLTTDFVETVEELNNKPLMGTLPPLPWALTEKLCTAYLDQGVRAFCVDFAGRTPSASEALSLRPLLKRLRTEGLADEVLFYAINASTGKASKNGPREIVPAKDILSFGFSFDVLGLKHVGLPGGAALEMAKRKQGPRVRLFDKESYAYRDAAPSRVGTIRPTDTAVPAAALSDEGRRTLAQSIVNMEQQAIEAVRLRKVIASAEVATYLATKSALDPADLKRFRSAKKDLVQQRDMSGWE